MPRGHAVGSVMQANWSIRFLIWALAFVTCRNGNVTRTLCLLNWELGGLDRVGFWGEVPAMDVTGGSESSELQKLLKDGKREDGRGLEQFRPVFLKTGVLSQASGSTYAEFGKTKVMVAVYGPRPVDRRVGFREEGVLKCEIYREAKPDRELSSLLKVALHSSILLEHLPKSSIDVFGVILENGGCELSVLTTAASVALAQVGAEMVDLVAACSVASIGGKLFLDPSTSEQAAEEGGMTLAIMPTSKEVTQVVTTGGWSSGSFREALELCTSGCAQIKEAMRQCLVQGHGATKG